jgi:hypothetical protein
MCYSATEKVGRDNACDDASNADFLSMLVRLVWIEHIVTTNENLTLFCPMHCDVSPLLESLTLRLPVT